MGSDVVVLHANPKLPGQEEVEGGDSIRIYEAFAKSKATLLVHGHQHTQEVVTVLTAGPHPKVVVNSDCRLVVLLPDPLILEVRDAEELKDRAGLRRKLQELATAEGLDVETLQRLAAVDAAGVDADVRDPGVAFPLTFAFRPTRCPTQA